MHMIDFILKQYGLNSPVIDVIAAKSGNINNTFVVTLEENNCHQRYIIQQINQTVFKNPQHVMENIENVSDYLNQQLLKEHDSRHKVLEIVKTTDKKPLICVENDGKTKYFRIYKFVENSTVYETSQKFSNRQTTSNHKRLSFNGKAIEEVKSRF